MVYSKSVLSQAVYPLIMGVLHFLCVALFDSKVVVTKFFHGFFGSEADFRYLCTKLQKYKYIIIYVEEVCRTQRS